MFYVGIDIAKSSHFASVVNSDGEVIVKPFKFSNDIYGFNLFLNNIIHLDKDSIFIGLEATGHYGDAITSFLFDKGFKIGRINPIQTDALRSSNIRKTKTDKIDTLLISKCLVLGHYSLLSSVDINIIKLKSFCRFRFDISHSVSKLKTQLVSCLDTAFPELSSIFTNSLHIKSVYALLLKYPSASDIASARIDSLFKLINTTSSGHFKYDTALLLKNTAKTSVTVFNPAVSLQIKLIIEQIQLLQEQLNSLDTQIKHTMDNLNSPILSIPGINYTLGAIILSEINDISKFSNSSKLLAFAGLDPSVKQSGNFNASNTRISKRGSKHLRYALHRAASLIIWNNDTFRTYYTTKRSTGKSHLNAIGHVAHKLVRVIYHILSTNTTFNLS